MIRRLTFLPVINRGIICPVATRTTTRFRSPTTTMSNAKNVRTSSTSSKKRSNSTDQNTATSTTTTTVYFTIASLPLLLWFRDTFVSVTRISGSSMEPTLRDGDYVLVRKSDWGVLFESSLGAFVSPPHSNTTYQPDVSRKDPDSSFHSSSSSMDETERARVKRMEQLSSDGGRYTTHARLYEHPPVILPGHVVVLKSPDRFGENCVKRVVAVGGQSWTVPPVNSKDSYSLSRQRRLTDGDPRPCPSSPRRSPPIEVVQPFTVYVLGDNTPQSRDSRHYGHVSKNLVTGVVERVIWPPSRWGKGIQRQPHPNARWI